SASCPAFRSRKAMSAEYGLEQAQRSQVAQLRERAEKLKAKRETQDIYIAPAPPTIGSRGHPQLCRRPCTHFARRSCPHGSKCSFCHLPHDHVSLDKRMRGLLASCSESLLLWTLRPYFASHADPAALVFQELLDRELVLRHPQPPVLPSNKSWQLLHKRLARLPLSVLVGLCFRVSGRLPALLLEQLSELRQAGN
ncbi:unnamed protein product, partial [Effrenium voratum]